MSFSAHSSTLRQLLKATTTASSASSSKVNCISTPGVFCGIVGRMAKQRGFKAGYVSGAALTASYGVPDIGVLSLDYFSSKIKEISTVAGGAKGGFPLLCDADTGFGEAEMVSRTVVEYIQAGAGGLHLEDQVFPKRCGHLLGKSLIPTSDFIKKIQNARKASEEYSNGEFIICARTDARSVDGFDASVARAKAYIEEGGADMIFPEGLQSKEEFKEFAIQMRESVKRKQENTGLGQTIDQPVYLLANMTEFGQTPYLSCNEFGDMGYHICIFPVSTLRCAMKGAAECLDGLMDDNKSVEQAGLLEKMYTRKELYGTLGYTPGEEWNWPKTTKGGS